MESIDRTDSWLGIELRHLAALEAVARTGTFGRAASDLGYTQSAVSQQIAALEKIVGEPLFDRPGGPRPVEITRLGEVLLEHARAIVSRVGEAGVDLAGFRAGRTGRLTIGTFQSVSVEILPSVLKRYREEEPELQVVQSHAPGGEGGDLLRVGEEIRGIERMREGGHLSPSTRINKCQFPGKSGQEPLARPRSPRAIAPKTLPLG